MSNPKQRIRNIKLSRNKIAVVFDKRRGVAEGDTIRVGEFKATFKNLLSNN